MATKIPQAYRALVCGLPYGPELLREAEGVRGPGGIEVDDVASWWRLVLIACAGNPTPEVARWILMGEG